MIIDLWLRLLFFKVCSNNKRYEDLTKLSAQGAGEENKVL